MRRNLWLGVAIMIIFALSSCASALNAPTLLDTANDPLTAEQKPVTDKVLFQFSDQLRAWWGNRSINAEVFGTGTLIALDAVTSAALATAGAGVGTTRGLVSAIDFIKSLYTRIDPRSRDNAFNTGSTIILAAQGEYLTCLTQRRSAVPSDKTVSPCGAKFGLKVFSAISTVGNLMVGILPSKEDFNNISNPVTATMPDTPTP